MPTILITALGGTGRLRVPPRSWEGTGTVPRSYRSSRMKNRRLATRYDVGKTAGRPETVAERDQHRPTLGR